MKAHLPAPTILKFLVFVLIFCWQTKPAQALEYQSCTVGQTCTIGEFLYDDNSAPDATASCSVTSRYPDGNLFVNAGAATANSSGWYSYTTPTSSTEGIYPTQICCTTTGDYLCLDKTFKYVSSSTSGGASAADIWNYPNRSLTSFGNLVSDIWGYSSRSLSSFGNLVTDIWNRDDRTLTSGESSNAEILSEIREIKKTTAENRLYLEQLVNKPVVKTFIDDSSTPTLTQKIESTKTAAENIYSKVQNLKSRSLLLKQKWSSLSLNEIKSELTSLAGLLTEDGGHKDSSLIATTTSLKTSWNTPILLSLSDQAQAVSTQINSLLYDLNLGNTFESDDPMSSVIFHLENLNELVGTSLASPNELSLFGFIKKTTDRVSLLDKNIKEGDRILSEIKKNKDVDQSVAIINLLSSTLEINEIPQVDIFFEHSNKTLDTPTNKVLSLMAISDTNKQILRRNIGEALNNIWLEEGSIIFRAVATNPSHFLTQKVQVKYYLPAETKLEQVISHDPSLTIEQDPIENSLYASGEVTLAPDSSRTFLVEVEDIWSFKPAEIDSYKNQVTDLLKILSNSSEYAQAASIKSDIFVTLDKIMLRQEQALTPENRIRTYRESALEMNGVEEKILTLKGLVIESHSNGLFSFARGMQPITLWGILLLITAGFVFLYIYSSALRNDSQSKKVEKETKEAIKHHDELYHPAPKYHHRTTPHHPLHRTAKLASIALLLGGASSLSVATIIRLGRSLSLENTSARVLGISEEKKYPYQTTLKSAGSGSIPAHKSPAISSPKAKSFQNAQPITVLKTLGGWAQVTENEKDKESGLWVSTDYLSK